MATKFIIEEKCNLCGICIDACIQGAISKVDEKMVISEACVNARACPAADLCPQEAIGWSDEEPLAEGVVLCERCPIRCQIRPGNQGECGMYTNHNGVLVRNVPLTTFEDMEDIIGPECDPVIRKPLLTGIGAGTTFTTPLGGRMAPYIVQDQVSGVDVITSVSEASYGWWNCRVKVDAEAFLGYEGDPVYHEGTKVGYVADWGYGSQFLNLGGPQSHFEKHGWRAAKVSCDICNRKRVELRTKDAKMELQIGQPPVIDGVKYERRIYAVGHEISGLLQTEFLKEALEKGIINEGVVIARIGSSQFPYEYHPLYFNYSTTGLKLKGEEYSTGLSFLSTGGKGWGQMVIEDPFDIIDHWEKERESGWRVLFTQTDLRRVALYELTAQKTWKQIEIPDEVNKGLDVLRDQCEPGNVSAYYVAGSGGVVRKSVTKRPLRLTEAVMAKKACVTIGGAPTTVFSGGGIQVMVDVSRVKPGSFVWTFASTLITPVEFTMTLETFKEIGGHVERIRSLAEVLEEIKKNKEALKEVYKQVSVQSKLK